jgi:hypothetical protein
MLLKEHGVPDQERYTSFIFVKILEGVQGVPYATRACAWALAGDDSHHRALKYLGYTRAPLQSALAGRPAGTGSSRHCGHCRHFHAPGSRSCPGGGAGLAHHRLGTVDAQAQGHRSEPCCSRSSAWV